MVELVEYTLDDGCIYKSVEANFFLCQRKTGYEANEVQHVAKQIAEHWKT